MATYSYKEDPYPDLSQIAAVRAIFVSIFCAEFFVGVVGNLMVVLTVIRNKAMHSPVNYYIVNLSICDFLVGAFVLPTKLFELTAEASLNGLVSDGWCTAVRYLETILVFASVFSLTAICIKRCYAVAYPVQVQGCKNGFSDCVCVRDLLESVFRSEPHHSASVRQLFTPRGQFFFTMLCIKLLLCFTNSCVSPFVYFAMSTRFRQVISAFHHKGDSLRRESEAILIDLRTFTDPDPPREAT